ncbi:MAG TPA: type II toxin-antitoxin system PemK/MazF family toxin, partial [Paludibacter sp.]|nr:type II toxin-antitoxin system PemK/MazF family toxin [Paludibacter sp.]
MNKYLNTIILCPMTTNIKAYPSRISVEHDGKKGMIAVDQIRTVDKIRIIKLLGKLTNSEIKKIKSVIKETFVD